MHPDRVPHFEIKLGVCLVLLNCVRIILPWHGYGTAIRLLFDTLAILGGMLVLLGIMALRGSSST